MVDGSAVPQVGQSWFLARAFHDDNLEVVGKAGEQVRIVAIDSEGVRPYRVAGTSCNGKPFNVARRHLMFTRPIG